MYVLLNTRVLSLITDSTPSFDSKSNVMRMEHWSFNKPKTFRHGLRGRRNIGHIVQVGSASPKIALFLRANPFGEVGEQ